MKTDHCQWGCNDPYCVSQMIANAVKTQEQALRCESSNHWAMAAILWRRLAVSPSNKYWATAAANSRACELVLYKLAVNVRFSLLERKPLFEKDVRK